MSVKPPKAEVAQGVAQDYAEAVKWWRKAAEQGYVLAQLNLGTSYAEGQGVAQDYVSAHMWFNLAAAQGWITGRKRRDAIQKNMPPDQIAAAQRMAREWMAKHQQ